jgi:hypothetical protein
MPSLVQRLKERKIVHWAVVYLAGAWLFLEALGFVADTFGWATCAGPSIQGGTS